MIVKVFVRSDISLRDSLNGAPDPETVDHTVVSHSLARAFVISNAHALSVLKSFHLIEFARPKPAGILDLLEFLRFHTRGPLSARDNRGGGRSTFLRSASEKEEKRSTGRSVGSRNQVNRRRQASIDERKRRLRYLKTISQPASQRWK